MGDRDAPQRPTRRGRPTPDHLREPLKWVAAFAGTAKSPFGVPWTCRVAGAPGTYRFDGFPAGVTPDWRTSNIAAVSGQNGLDLIAKALKTTRDRQIEEKKPSWRRGLRTREGRPRRTLPTADLRRLTSQMPPTTLFNLLYRLRIRSNYQEADAFLAGAVSSIDATSFHAALCDVVAATLLTVEIHIAHQVGPANVRAALRPLTVPTTLEPHSVVSRQTHW